MKKNKIKLLAGAALLGLSTLTLASCKNPIDVIKGWFDDDPVTTETPTTSDDITVDGTDVEQGTSVPLPKQAIFKKASHRTALTVKATVLPVDATQKKLSWSLAWKTTSSETISNYVTISPSADTLSCSITVKKGFNVPINLTAKSIDGPSATCQLDFLKQVERFSFECELPDENESTVGDSYSFNFGFGEDSKKYSEYDNRSSSFGDYLHFWNHKNSNIQNYYSNTIGYSGDSYPVMSTSIVTVGTVGEIRRYYSDLSDYSTTYTYYTMTFSDAAKTALSNAGYSSYINTVYNEESSSLNCNIFTDMFKQTNMTDATAKGIMNTLKGVEGDIVNINFTFQSWYNGSSMNTQTAVFGVQASIHNYIPTSSISFDNSTIVAS